VIPAIRSAGRRRAADAEWPNKEGAMGLMDILNGMQNGPRGQSEPPAAGSQSGGMSPMMMALLGLLAYKAIKGGGLGNMFGGQTAPQPAPAPAPSNMQTGGGLGDILGSLFGGSAPSAGQSGGLGGMLGGLLGGGAASGGAGEVLNSGLGNILKDLQNSGQGRAAQSWVGTGANEQIEPGDLGRALGSDTIDALSQQTGLGRDDLLAGLSQRLPELVDQLTPHGRLPTEQEASRW
jgi:uncharacterized protein YidB (DUF937 family)